MNARTSSSRSVGGAQVVDVIGIASHLMKLGFYMGYAQPGTNPLELLELAREAEGVGYDSAWAAEAWGVDAITPLAWLGAQTTTLKLGTAIMQLPGRSPANAAMTAVTLDLLSGGRFLMGLGTSGPQVVEGWHGQEWGKPLGKTREYVEIVRTILRRERLEHHGEHYDIPVQGGTGLGKPLKLMARPLRADIPIYLAAIGPKAVEQTLEIADGWLPIFWSPEKARTVFPVDRAREGFDVAATAPAIVTDDVESARAMLKEYYSFYIGGMGARGKNFYNDLFTRYGYEAEAREIQDLFLDGKQREAAAKVPDAFVDEVALIGSIERIRDRLAAWRESGATTLLVSTRDAATLRGVAEAAA
jgi:F420-dependent oxidoreductase-like protein